VTDQPRHPHPRPSARHPRRPLPDARRAWTILAALPLSLAALAATAPAASATPAPPEPPPGPPPPPLVVTAAGLPLWAVLVILGGTIALSAATTLITLALQPTVTWRRPRPPARALATVMHQPRPPARPAIRDHTSDPGPGPRFVMARHPPRAGHRATPTPGLIPLPARLLPAQPLSGPRPRTAAAYPTSQEVVMNPIHRTRRLSLILAGLAAALALPACQGTGTAASHRPPHHHAAQAIVQEAQSGITFADLQDLANVKRDLFQRMAQQTQAGLTFADLQDLTNVKRDLFQGMAERSPTR
jgi:hypothetical protein